MITPKQMLITKINIHNETEAAYLPATSVILMLAENFENRAKQTTRVLKIITQKVGQTETATKNKLKVGEK